MESIASCNKLQVYQLNRKRRMQAFRLRTLRNFNPSDLSKIQNKMVVSKLQMLKIKGSLECSDRLIQSQREMAPKKSVKRMVTISSKSYKVLKLHHKENEKASSSKRV